MNFAHLIKLAGKFVVRGFIFKSGKKAAVKGGNVGIAAGALLAGGFLAYQLIQERKKEQKAKNKITTKEREIIV